MSIFLFIFYGHYPLQMRAFLRPDSIYQTIWSWISITSEVFTGPLVIPIVQSALKVYQCDISDDANIDTAFSLPCFGQGHIGLCIMTGFLLGLYLMSIVRVQICHKNIGAVDLRLNIFDWRGDLTTMIVSQQPFTVINNQTGVFENMISVALVFMQAFLGTYTAAIANIILGTIALIVGFLYTKYEFAKNNHLLLILNTITLFTFIHALVTETDGKESSIAVLLPYLTALICIAVPFVIMESRYKFYKEDESLMGEDVHLPGIHPDIA